MIIPSRDLESAGAEFTQDTSDLNKYQTKPNTKPRVDLRSEESRLIGRGMGYKWRFKGVPTFQPDLLKFLTAIYQTSKTTVNIIARPRNDSDPSVKQRVRAWDIQLGHLRRSEWLQRMIVQASRTHDIFHLPNRVSLRLRDEYISRVRFVDSSSNPGLDLDKLQLKPSLIVNFKGTRQLYWLARKPVRWTCWWRWQMGQPPLFCCNGDQPHCGDPLLELSLPPLYTGLKQPYLNFLEVYEPDLRYTDDEMLAALGTAHI